MATLAIRGHAARGKEVIELLEMLGGENKANYIGDGGDDKYFPLYYCIKEDGKIDILYDLEAHKSYMHFTLEKFLAKYPYKVMDRVKNVYGAYGKVYDMKWIDDKIAYRLDFGHHISGWYRANELQPYKEEKDFGECIEETMQECLYGKKEGTMGEKKTTVTFEYKVNGEEIELVIPDNQELVINDGKVILKDKKPQYPKTYKECFNICFGNYHHIIQVVGLDGLGNNKELFENFIKLKICRDAYWKIAGKHMGLDKPWEPDWNSLDRKYSVYNYRGNTSHDNFTVTDRCILVFPTEEMRDDFYKNFNDLIEQCKELL